MTEISLRNAMKQLEAARDLCRIDTELDWGQELLEDLQLSIGYERGHFGLPARHSG